MIQNLRSPSNNPIMNNLESHRLHNVQKLHNQLPRRLNHNQAIMLGYLDRNFYIGLVITTDELVLTKQHICWL